MPSAANASLKGTPVDAAAEGAAEPALVGIMNGAAKGAAGAEPVEGAAAEGAAGSAAEVEAVLLLAAVCALEAGLNVHPLVPKLAAEDCLP